MDKLTRRQGVLLQTIGSILIVTVMLTDHFLFSLAENYILACAIVSAVLLIIGIRTVKRYDEKEAEAKPAGKMLPPQK